jgi:hypothetical protein
VHNYLYSYKQPSFRITYPMLRSNKGWIVHSSYFCGCRLPRFPCCLSRQSITAFQVSVAGVAANMGPTQAVVVRQVGQLLRQILVRYAIPGRRSRLCRVAHYADLGIVARHSTARAPSIASCRRYSERVNTPTSRRRFRARIPLLAAIISIRWVVAWGHLWGTRSDFRTEERKPTFRERDYQGRSASR